jgi:hypothetical protein
VDDTAKVKFAKLLFSGKSGTSGKKCKFTSQAHNATNFLACVWVSTRERERERGEREPLHDQRTRKK